MVENTQVPNVVPNPLDENLDGMGTPFPVLKAGMYRLEVKSAAVVSKKAPKVGENLLIEFKTTADGKSTKGEVLHSGYPIRHYISKYDSPGEEMDRMKKSIASFVKATGKKGLTARMVLDHPEQFVGAIVDAWVKVTKPTDDYPNEGNAIGKFEPVP